MNYTGANGIKVESVASAVGTGWDLNVGGMVMRQQHGEPDDQRLFATYTYPTAPNAAVYFNWTSSSYEYQNYKDYVNNYYPNGYLFSEYSPSDFINDNANVVSRTCIADRKTKPPPVYLADREIDVFTFSFNGRVGSFVIGKMNASNVFPVKMLDAKDDNLKIEPVFDDALLAQNIRTTLRKFKITDETGIQYFFEEMELDEIIVYNQESHHSNDGQIVYLNGQPHINSMEGPCFQVVGGGGGGSQSPPTLSHILDVQRGSRTGKYIANRWMLTKIVNPLTGNSIRFTYEDKESQYEGGTRFSTSTMNFNNTVYPSRSILREMSSSRGKRLLAIENDHGEKVELVYGEARKDLPGDKVLASLILKKQMQEIERFEFTYGYFMKKSIVPLNYTFSAAEEPYIRLCLLEMQRKSIDVNEPPYKFEYFTHTDPNSPNDIVAPRFSYCKDQWGYYYPFDDFQTPIIEPAGLNTYSEALLNKGLDFYSKAVNENLPPCSLNGLIKSITFPSGGKGIYTYERNFAYEASDVIGGMHVKTYTLQDGVDLVKYEYSYLKESSNLTSSWGHEAYVNYQTKKLYAPPCDEPMVRYQTSSVINAYNLPYLFNMGRMILSASLNGTALDPAAFLQQIVSMIVSYFLGSGNQNWPQGVDVEIKNSESITAHNLLPIMFSRVEVKTIGANNNLIGKEVHEFTSDSDYPVEIASSQYMDPYPYTWRCYVGRYGLLKKKSVYDASNNKQLVEEFVYQTLAQPLNDLLFASSKWGSKAIAHGCGVDISYGAFTSQNLVALSGIYYPLIGSVKLAEHKTYTYNTVGDFVMLSKQFAYNSNNLLSSQKETDSRGRVTESIIKYPADYTISGVLHDMKNANMISVPILTESYLYKTPTDKYLLGGKINGLSVVSNGDIKLTKTYQFISPSAVNNNSIAPFSANQLIRDVNYYKATGELMYDGQGATIQTNGIIENTNPSTGITTAHIINKTAMVNDMGNQNAVIASATNANRSDIAYTSFDSPMEVINWTYNENLVTREEFMSGDKCLKMDQQVRTIIKNGLNQGIKYKITFWAKNIANNNFTLYVNKNGELAQGTTYLLNSITPAKVFTNISTGWSLYECYVTNATSITINNQNAANAATGNAMYVDEVRLYPEGASMSTCTYDFRGLKTSSVDANNKVLYTEYDGLGRIRLIRDEYRNVIKTYEYNFKN